MWKLRIFGGATLIFGRKMRVCEKFLMDFGLDLTEPYRTKRPIRRPSYAKGYAGGELFGDMEMVRNIAPYGLLFITQPAKHVVSLPNGPDPLYRWMSNPCYRFCLQIWFRQGGDVKSAVDRTERVESKSQQPQKQLPFISEISLDI